MTKIDYDKAAQKIVAQATVCGELIIETGLRKQKLLERHHYSTQCEDDLKRVALDEQGRVLNIHGVIATQSRVEKGELAKYYEAVDRLLADKKKWRCTTADLRASLNSINVIKCEVVSPAIPKLRDPSSYHHR